MKFRSIILLTINVGLVSVIGCEIFLETDISNREVTILSPPDGLETTLSSQTFWWEYVEDAEQYNLQIVSPLFSNIIRLFVDTITASNKFSYNLLPGEYEWRVMGANYSSQTPYTTYKLVIDSTSDISQEIIQLLLPKNNDTSNNTSITFFWEKLYNATEYNFQLFYNGLKYYSIILGYDTITMSLDQGDGGYEWRVRGQNEFSNTSFSSRSLYIDTEPPNRPILLQPVDNVILPDSIIEFSWDRGLETGSSIMDSLFIYGDHSLGELLIAKYLSNPSFSDSLGPGEFYWRVRSIDAAGNKSPYSIVSHFSVQ